MGNYGAGGLYHLPSFGLRGSDCGWFVRNWWSYEGDKIGQGRENAKNYLRQNPDFCKMIEEQVREHYFAQETEEEPEAEEKAAEADKE